MATAYEDVIKNIGPLTNRTSDQEDLYNYALNKVSSLETGTSDPYVQQILSAYKPLTQTQNMQNVQSQGTQINPVGTEPIVTQVTAAGQAAAAPQATATPPNPVNPLPTSTVPQTTSYDQSLQEQLTNIENYPEFQANPAYQQMITELLQNIDPNFTYSAENDQALIQAQQEVDRQIREQMAKRGALYSDATASLVVQEMGKLVPQFRAQAQNEFQQTLSNKLTIVQTLEGLINDDYMKYTDKYDRQFQFLQLTSNLKQQELDTFQREWENQYKLREEQRSIEINDLNKKAQEFDQALQRVNMLGYVDNVTSAILGLPVGTQTFEAKQAALKRQQEIEDRERAIQVQAQRDKEERAWQLEYLKAQEQSTKNIASYNAKLNKSSGGGGGSAGGGGTGTASQKSLYNNALAQLTQAASDSSGSDAAFRELVYMPDDAIAIFGAANYTKLLNSAHNLYYQKLQNSWSGSNPKDILGSLSKGEYFNMNGKKVYDKDFYKKMLGSANYNKYIAWATAQAKTKAKNPYYGS